MHRWHVDPAEVERHVRRRGRRDAFERIDPARTALVVIDMIPFFVDANRYARGIVPNVNRLAAVVRGSGGFVVWVVPAIVEPSGRDREFFGDAAAATYARSAGADACEPRDRIVSELAQSPVDLVVEKRLRGALFPGSSELDVLLRDRDVDTVLVAGTAADVCCESTVREAFSLGYRVAMVADACAAGSDDALNATLRTVYRSFGDVRPTVELIGAIEGCGKRDGAPAGPLTRR